MSSDFNPSKSPDDFSLDELLLIADKAGPVYSKTIEDVLDEQHDKCHERLRDIAYEYVMDLYARGLLSPCLDKYEEDMRHLIGKIIECGGDPDLVFSRAMNYDVYHEAEVLDEQPQEEVYDIIPIYANEDISNDQINWTRIDQFDE